MSRNTSPYRSTYEVWDSLADIFVDLGRPEHELPDSVAEGIRAEIVELLSMWEAHVCAMTNRPEPDRSGEHQEWALQAAVEALRGRPDMVPQDARAAAVELYGRARAGLLGLWVEPLDDSNAA